VKPFLDDDFLLKTRVTENARDDFQFEITG
jgi:hypothetical protein